PCLVQRPYCPAPPSCCRRGARLLRSGPPPWPGDTLQNGTTHDEATEGPAPRDARGHDGRGRGLGELGGSHSGRSERGEVCEVRRRRVERQQELARPGAAALEP